eukprot:1958158-Prymnesium_polylepis.1
MPRGRRVRPRVRMPSLGAVDEPPRGAIVDAETRRQPILVHIEDRECAVPCEEARHVEERVHVRRVDGIRCGLHRRPAGEHAEAVEAVVVDELTEASLVLRKDARQVVGPVERTGRLALSAIVGNI